MAEFIKKEIMPATELLCVPANRFKTNEISVNLALPLTKDTASVNALLISLLSRKCKKYPDITAFNLKRDMLYGADVNSAVAKVGEIQLLKLGITGLDDRFALDKNSISESCLKLLLDLLFYPDLDDNDLFKADDLEAEKRILKEKLEAEENEKRIYAVRRLEEIMFKNEPFSVNRYGTKETIDAISTKSLTEAWHHAIEKSKILVTVVGNIDTDKAEKTIAAYFSNVSRSFNQLPKTLFVPKSTDIKDVTEKENIRQGKLVLGFRVDMRPDSEKAAAMRSFCDLFGGGPYSRLFMNVREKLSLCYYCSARYVRQKSYLYIQCGCEEKNMQKAVDEILRQLEQIKNGNCSEELESSKIALSDAIDSVYDAPSSLEAWYTLMIADDEYKTPTESKEQNQAVTVQDIKECASLITLDTVYRLVSNGEVQE